MSDKDLKRVTRLTAIVTQLQTRRLLTAAHLAGQFGVTVRTIYRDIRALEDAGIPVLTIDGRGYSLMEGYHVPPLMFSDAEANALITAEQVMSAQPDNSFSAELVSALNKIRAVLRQSTRDKAELLSSRIAVSPVFKKAGSGKTMSLIQSAITEFEVVEIDYLAADRKENTRRAIEPFALYYSREENWILIGWCRLRKDFRMFRLDRMTNSRATGERFEPHKMTLEEYLARKQKNFHP